MSIDQSVLDKFEAVVESQRGSPAAGSAPRHRAADFQASALCVPPEQRTAP